MSDIVFWNVLYVHLVFVDRFNWIQIVVIPSVRICQSLIDWIISITKIFSW